MLGRYKHPRRTRVMLHGTYQPPRFPIWVAVVVAVILSFCIVKILDTEHAHPMPVCSSDADCASKGLQDAYGVTPEKVVALSDRYYPHDIQDDNGNVLIDPVGECLLGMGYRGIPGDGEDVIYAPRDAIESCVMQYNPDPRFNDAGPIRGIISI